MIGHLYAWLPAAPSFFSSCVKQQKYSPFESPLNLNDLSQKLINNIADFEKWIEAKEEIKMIISQHVEEVEQLNQFFKAMTTWGMKQDPQKMMSFFLDIVSLEVLEKVVIFKQKNSSTPFCDIFDWATQQASQCLEPPNISLQAQFQAEWKKCRSIVFYFIPNLINIFLGAFNFLDSHKKFTTLWEKHLLLEIVYKFFIIPCCLIKVLQPVFVVTAKVYLIASVIIIGLGLLLSCYQRWLRPLPEEILNCLNLEKQIDVRCPEPKIGQTKEMNDLLAALEVNRPVILIGLSGQGKTALVHHFIQLKRQKVLSDKLQRLTVYENDCGSMICSFSYGYSELINQMKDQMMGYEDQILLFFDEFKQITDETKALRAFKKRFLEDEPRSKFIAALTCKEWKELEKDPSFKRRVHLIEILPSTDEDIQKILKNFQYRFAKDIPVTEDAIQAIVEISGQLDYQPEIGRPSKAKKLFERAVGLCRVAYSSYYLSINLEGDQLELAKKQVQKIKNILVHQQKMSTHRDYLAHFFSKISKEQIKIKERLIPLSLSKESINEKDQILYLWYNFYAVDALKECLEVEIQKIDAQIPLQVNRDLIFRVYKREQETQSLIERKKDGNTKG